MKFINLILILVFILFSSCKKNKVETDENPLHKYPPYRLIREFSQKIRPQTGLILRSYGINCHSPDNYIHKNKSGIGSIKARYSLPQKRQDTISLEHARSLIVYLTENLSSEINHTPEIQKHLGVQPFISDFIYLSIYFEDDLRVELAQGVANVTLVGGKITYEGYNIREYRDQYPAIGKHYIIHEESYADALKLVQNQGEFFNYTSPS